MDPLKAQADQHDARCHFEQGWQALNACDWKTAAEAFTRVTHLAPAIEVGHFNLGNALFELKRFRDAAASYQRAFELEPSRGTLNNLGNAWASAGELQQAIQCYRQALAMPPDSADAAPISQQSESIYGNLGRALEAIGQWDEAATLYRHAVRVAPSITTVKLLLRSCLWQTDSQPTGEALEAFKQLGAADDELHLLAAACHERLGEFSLALRSLVQANQLAPDSPRTLAQLAAHQLLRGRHAEATICLHRALTLQRPAAALHSQWLATTLYHPHSSDSKFHEEARRWATIHAPALSSIPTPVSASSRVTPGNARSRKRASSSTQQRLPLRLGVVLTTDADSFSIQCWTALVRNLDDQAIAVHCYSDWICEERLIRPLRDAVQARGPGRWQQTAHLSDEQLRQRIRSDDIDCLIDVSGHGLHSRLLVFAQRAARLQLAWSSVPATSGLSSMDAILADEIMLPPSSQDAFTETPYLVESAHCFLLPEDVAAHAQRVRAWEPTHMSVRLGALCPPAKLTPEVVSTWSEILEALPQTQLHLADEAFADESILQETKGRFVQAGIDAQRIDLQTIESPSDAVAWMERTDLLLDPFPIGHPLTVCRSLVMGVPAICMASDIFCGRVSASIMHSLGLDSSIARSERDYRERAVEKVREIEQARQTPRGQAQTRLQLHQQMVTSRLCDAASFAESVTTVLLTQA